MPLAAVSPLVGSLKPPKSGGWVRYLSSILIDGSTALTPGVEAGLELLDQRHVHAADEADVLGLGLQRGRDADEVGALLLGEGQVGRRSAPGTELSSMMANLTFGYFGTTALTAVGVGEADRDDRGVAVVGELGQPGLLVGFGLALSRCRVP